MSNPEASTGGILSSVVAVSPSLAWAVGQISGVHLGSAPLIERWDGRQWTVDTYTIPGGASILQSVTATSVTNAWAGGYGSGENDGALIERWDGTKQRWSQVSTTIGNYIDSISAASTSDVWAVGPPNAQFLFVQRWNGKKWRRSKFPKPAGVALQQINAAPDTGMKWLVGLKQLGSTESGVVYRYDGKHWKDMHAISPSRDTELFSILQVPGSGDTWAFGTYGKAGGSKVNLAERYTCGSPASSLLQKGVFRQTGAKARPVGRVPGR